MVAQKVTGKDPSRSKEAAVELNPSSKYQLHWTLDQRKKQIRCGLSAINQALNGSNEAFCKMIFIRHLVITQIHSQILKFFANIAWCWESWLCELGTFLQPCWLDEHWFNNMLVGKVWDDWCIIAIVKCEICFKVTRMFTCVCHPATAFLCNGWVHDHGDGAFFRWCLAQGQGVVWTGYNPLPQDDWAAYSYNPWPQSDDWAGYNPRPQSDDWAGFHPWPQSSKWIDEIRESEWALESAGLGTILDPEVRRAKCQALFHPDFCGGEIWESHGSTSGVPCDFGPWCMGWQTVWCHVKKDLGNTDPKCQTTSAWTVWLSKSGNLTLVTFRF